VTHSDEHVCSSLHELVCWAVDSPCTLFTALLTVAGMVVAVWVLDVALVAILGVVAVGNVGVGGCDMAVGWRGLGGGTGVRGVIWGEQSGVGGCRGRHWRCWDWHSRSVKCTTCSDEHVCTTSCNGVCWAVDGVGASFTAW